MFSRRKERCGKTGSERTPVLPQGIRGRFCFRTRGGFWRMENRLTPFTGYTAVPCRVVSDAGGIAVPCRGRIFDLSSFYQKYQKNSHFRHEFATQFLLKKRKTSSIIVSTEQTGKHDHKRAHPHVSLHVSRPAGRRIDRSDYHQKERQIRAAPDGPGGAPCAASAAVRTTEPRRTPAATAGDPARRAESGAALRKPKR